MQTFVPDGPHLYDGFLKLDSKRLGKQRVEAWQILNVLMGVDNSGKPKEHTGWVNHPATRMWYGHESALAFYGYLCCRVWLERGYKDSLLIRFSGRWFQLNGGAQPLLPEWLSDSRVYISHRSNLLRKNRDHYYPYWPNLADDMPYFWPQP